MGHEYMTINGDNGYRAVIEYEGEDLSSDNPMDWENAALLACWHRRYTLGNKHEWGDVWDMIYEFMVDADILPETYPCKWADGDVTQEDVDTSEDLSAYFEEDIETAIASLESVGYKFKSLYLYDHSGLTMNTSGFSCSWDSGQVGVVYMTPEMVEKEGMKEYDDEKIGKVLDGVVETYDMYLRGEVFWIAIEDPFGEQVDSVGMVYGYDYAEEEARRMLKDAEGASAKYYSRYWGDMRGIEAELLKVVVDVEHGYDGTCEDLTTKLREIVKKVRGLRMEDKQRHLESIKRNRENNDGS